MLTALLLLIGLVILGLLLDIRQRIRSSAQAIGRNSAEIRDNTEEIRSNTGDIRESRSLVATHVGHELRTPLTIITGTLSILESHYDRIPPEKASDMLRGAIQQAAVLESLIAGMLSQEPQRGNEGPSLNKWRRLRHVRAQSSVSEVQSRSDGDD
jgi:K+-sensing histidine kinase KdpD